METGNDLLSRRDTLSEKLLSASISDLQSCRFDLQIADADCKMVVGKDDGCDRNDATQTDVSIFHLIQLTQTTRSIKSPVFDKI